MLKAVIQEEVWYEAEINLDLHIKNGSSRMTINEDKYKVIFKVSLKKWLHKAKIEAIIIYVQNIHFSQTHKRHSSGQTICWVTKQALI